MAAAPPRPVRAERPSPVATAPQATAVGTMPPSLLTEPLRSGVAAPPRPTRQLPRPAAAPAPVPAPLPEPEYDDEEYYEDEDFGPRQESLLQNPYVLAAIAVFGAVILAVIVVIMAGGGGGGGSNVVIPPTQNPLTPVSGAANVNVISTSTVREGPGLEYDSLGTLSRGGKVQVTGQDEESRWFQIVFPQNSGSRGWVPSTALRVSDINMAVVPIVDDSQVITRPTAEPTATAYIPEPTEEPTVTPEEPDTTPTPGGPAADLNVAFLGACTAGSDASILVRNLSETPVVGRTLIITVNAGGVVSSLSTSLSLTSGEVVSIPLGVEYAAPQTTVSIELQGSADSDPSDNSVSCSPGGGAATPVPTATTPVGPEPTATPPIAIPPAP